MEGWLGELEGEACEDWERLFVYLRKGGLCFCTVLPTRVIMSFLYMIPVLQSCTPPLRRGT